MTFTPHRVKLRDTDSPLASCFGRSQIEIAAACLVLALQHLNADWGRCVTLDEVRMAMIVAFRNSDMPWVMLTAPPDFDGLVDGGFAMRSGSGDTSVLAFTADGIQALRLWCMD